MSVEKTKKKSKREIISDLLKVNNELRQKVNILELQNEYPHIWNIDIVPNWGGGESYEIYWKQNRLLGEKLHSKRFYNYPSAKNFFKGLFYA